MAAVKSQGTELFVLDETVSPSVVVQVDCPTNINLGSSSRDQIDITCLGDSERVYESGLGTPPQVTFDVVFDADSDSHRLLDAMQASGESAQFFVGLSNGTNNPTVTGGTLIAATGRDGWTFEASVISFAKNIAGNEVVRGSVTLQVSGPITRSYKTP
jgi:hypothetical protein